jgi:AcrR family transcriptional regulator
MPAQARSRERRDRILDAASKVFAETGFHGATMDAIAHEAGTSIGSLYRFFPDKDAVFQTLHEDHLKRLRAFLDAFAVQEIPDVPWRVLVERTIEMAVAFSLAEPGFRAVWGSLSFTGAMVLEGEAYNREFAERIEPLLSRVFPRIPKDELPVLSVVLVEVVTSMTFVIARRDEAFGARALEECKRLVVRYLAPYAEPDAEPRVARVPAARESTGRVTVKRKNTAKPVR